MVKHNIFKSALCAFFILCTTSLYAAHNTRTDLLTTTLGYDIIKQGEKLESDPSDIKEADLSKFKYVCQDPTFERNLRLNTKAFQAKVNNLCRVIVSLQIHKELSCQMTQEKPKVEGVYSQQRTL